MKTKILLLLGLLFLVSAALRFYSFDRKSLWLDEIYTFQDSRDGFMAHLKYYEENPINLHPPLFFIATHLFYPFPNFERDLSIAPLIFVILISALCRMRATTKSISQEIEKIRSKIEEPSGIKTRPLRSIIPKPVAPNTSPGEIDSGLS
jgi:hypothetical protein